MLTPFCTSLLQAFHFELSQIYPLGSGWQAMRRVLELCTTHARGSSTAKSMPDRPAFCLWGVLLVFTTASRKKAPLPQVLIWGKEEIPAAHCALVSFKLLGGSFSVRDIYKPSSFAKARLLIISQGCTYPPRPSTGVGEEQRRSFSTTPIISQD